MTRTRLGALGIFLSLCGLGCATPPKPPELDAFERLRQDPNVQAAKERSPDLVGAADVYLGRAREEWEGNDLYESRRDALIGHIKLRTALAIVEQDQAKKRIASATGEQGRADEEYGRLAKELASLNESIALLKRLGDERAASAAEKQKLAQQYSAEQQKAEAERQKLAQELSTEQEKAGAADKLKAAELALKTAETVEGNKYAAPQYSAALDMLERARQEFGAGNYGACKTSAELARQKAEECRSIAKPQYEQAGATAANKARDRALETDAAGISGVTVKIDRKGDVQRLVIPLHDLFSKKETGVAPGHEEVLDAIAKILKKYPTYPVQVTGYTDSKGKPEILVAMSLARAQSVYSALVARGVDPKRVMVGGQGSSDPISDNKSSSGRARNNRVEVVFLYH